MNNNYQFGEIIFFFIDNDIINLNIFQMKGQIVGANVHPLVLLSIVDHYNRVNGGLSNRKRVAGALLGEISNKSVEVSNSYGIPFEEDPNQTNIWFLDHLYHETMFNMFKKINSKEKFIGWYVTGDSVRPQDLAVNQVFRKYNPNSVLLVVDVQHNNQINLPTEAYVTVEEVDREGNAVKYFLSIPSAVKAYEPQEIGVEHLLREIKEIPLNTIDTNVINKIQSLQGLASKIQEIAQYLRNVQAGKLKANDKIFFTLQQIINLLPDLSSDQLIRSYSAKNNDIMFSIYTCAITRIILAIHTLLYLGKKDAEQKKEEKKDADKKDSEKKEGDKKDEKKTKK